MLQIINGKQFFAGTLPLKFKEKYPTTFSIIDATEIFIQVPSDLFVQSSTWSNYKHHNTGKVLIGCTPNSAAFIANPQHLQKLLCFK